MGVRGLQFYLEQCCQSASPTVSISELVESERQRRGLRHNQQLIIVVDGSNCIRHIYGNLEWIGGAQLKQFGEKARQFVQAFADIGVRLVFFFDGPTIEEKRRTWVERRIRTLESIYEVLDAIDRGTLSHAIPKSHFHLPPGLGQLSRVIFDILCGCEVYQSLTECDEEIAEYARSKRAFAILGQDSDYVILDAGSSLYLSMQHLNLEHMTTRLYDRWELARCLRIHISQLPLLATLMGNDIITSDELKRFHLQITKQRFPTQRIDFRKLVPNIAVFIRSLPRNQAHLFEMLSEISQRTLGNPARAGDIQASLDSYKARPRRDYEREERGRNDHWSRLLTEARRRHQSNMFPSMIYAIMKGLPFESSTSVEDFRKLDLPSFVVATQPIRERLYGILLHEKPPPRNGQHTVREWCMAGPGSLDEANIVPAVSPHDRHPGLMALWQENRPDLDSVRWNLFVHCVSPNLDVQRVRNSIPPYLVLTTLILFFINELHCLDRWEVEAMLATATCLKHYSAARLSTLPSDPISTKGIRVANLIMRSTFILYILLAACGYPLTVKETSPWLFFDGKLFQTKYNQAQTRASWEQLCEHRADTLEEFQSAHHIIFRNR